MKNFIRKSFVAVLIALPIFGTGSVWAQSCGAGKITSILEGGWNDNNFRFVIDYSKEKNVQLPNTEYSGWYMMFQPAVITKERVDAIRKLVTAAYFSGDAIRVGSAFNRCDNATQVELIR